MKQLLRMFGLFITLTLVGSLVSPLVLAQTETIPGEESVIESGPIDTATTDAAPMLVQDEIPAPPAEDIPVSEPEIVPPIDPVVDPVVIEVPPVLEEPAAPPPVVDPAPDSGISDPVVPNDPDPVIPETSDPEIVETVVPSEVPVIPVSQKPAKTTTSSGSAVQPLPTCQPASGMLRISAALTFCDVTVTPRPVTPTPSVTPTTTPTSSTSRISRIAVDCNGNGSVAIRNGVAGSTLTLGVRYKKTAASSWKDASGQATVVITTTTTSQRIYPFSIDVVTGVPADAFDIRVSVVGSTLVEFENIEVDSASLCPCFATPTPSPTPTNTPTETPTETPTDTPTETPTETPTSTPTETPTQTPTETPTQTPTETPTETPTVTPTPTGCEGLADSQQERQSFFQVQEGPCPTETVVVTPSPTVPPAVTPTPMDCPNRAENTQDKQSFLQVQEGPCPTDPPAEVSTPIAKVPPPTILVQALPSAGVEPDSSESGNGLLILMLASSVSLAGIGFLMARDSRSQQRD